jgi:hypothetical protein
MTEPIPVATIVHAIPNRTRLRIPSRRGDTALFASLATALSAMPGIQRATVQPTTGSVLLEHSKPLPKLLVALEEARLFRLAEGLQKPVWSAPVPIEPKILFAVAMGAFALWQLTQGRVFPPAITLGMYAASFSGLLSGHNVPDLDE